MLREHGRFGLLTQVLSMLQWDAAMLGDWALAEEAAGEGERLAEETGQRVWGAGITCGLSAVAAMHGDEERADVLAATAEREILRHGLSDMHSVLIAARGIAAVAAGRPDDAFAVLSRAFDPTDLAYHYRERFGAVGYFAEAAVECGRADEARKIIDGLAALTADGAAPALRAAVAEAAGALT
jgi:ATP/maltotriose-dependent transcriptional regulator MalT